MKKLLLLASLFSAISFSAQAEGLINDDSLVSSFKEHCQAYPDDENCKTASNVLSSSNPNTALASYIRQLLQVQSNSDVCAKINLSC